MTSQNSGTGREPARSCAECGTRAEPGQSFCDSCGAVLGWAGGPDRSAAAAPVSAGAAAAPARDSAAGRGAGDDPGWDAFNVASGGSGSARTGHDVAPAQGSAATATAGDEAHRRDDGAGRPAAGGGHALRPHEGADGGFDGTSDSGHSGQGSGTRQPGAASASASGQAGAPLSNPAPAGSGSTPPSSFAPPSSSGSAAPGAASAHAFGASGAGAAGAVGMAAPGQRDTPAAPPAGAYPAAPPAGFPSPGASDGSHPPDADTEPRAALGHGSPHPSSADTAGERARSLLIPVNDPGPRVTATPPVAPVLPGMPVAGRPQVRAPGPESGPEDGPPCPWCGTPNRPDRHFCGRCAMPMAGGPRPPALQTWWRRLLNFRNTETPWAGDRPRLRRGFGRVMNWVVGAVVLGLVITLIVNIGAGVDATRDHFAKRAPAPPDSVKASRSYPGHSAQLVFDKLSNTWWGPGVSQSGEGEWVEARFDQPTRLLDLVITSGTSTKVDQFQKSALPHRIEAQITTSDGKKSTRIINLDQSPGGQRRKFRVGEVSSVRFVLRSAYAADDKKQVSIAEIEFFGRSNSSSS
ncbi:zinc ribbon domain-containing protein [Streptomyces sp. NPDC048484]|uniref:zinc ribbon domain-containing protein n=1 Tax=Streptomyces sp. NPDC048484 TaxID=3155146 RepID=UPI0034347465